MLTDHDLLTKLSSDIDWLTGSFKDHLRQHFALNLILIVAVLGLMTTLIIGWK